MLLLEARICHGQSRRLGAVVIENRHCGKEEDIRISVEGIFPELTDALCH